MNAMAQYLEFPQLQETTPSNTVSRLSIPSQRISPIWLDDIFPEETLYICGQKTSRGFSPSMAMPSPSSLPSTSSGRAIRTVCTWLYGMAVSSIYAGPAYILLPSYRLSRVPLSPENSSGPAVPKSGNIRDIGITCGL